MTKSGSGQRQGPPPLRDRIRARLVDDVRHAWRFWSLRLRALGLLIMAWPDSLLYSYSLVPADLQGYLPGRTAVVGGLFGLSCLATLVKQKKPDGRAGAR